VYKTRNKTYRKVTYRKLTASQNHFETANITVDNGIFAVSKDGILPY